MLALLLFAALVALLVTLAPAILGVIGTMLGLFFTFILWAIAGFPDNTPRDTRPKAAVVAPAEEDPMLQLEAWERQDRARRAQARDAGFDYYGSFMRERARQERAKARRALLDAQKRVDAAIERRGHGEP